MSVDLQRPSSGPPESPGLPPAGVGARLGQAAGRLRPVQVGGLAALAMVAFVLARLVLAADGDVSRFVVAGDLWADPAAVDPPIHVFGDSHGYDGQFYWRLAVDPASRDQAPSHGVTLDDTMRSTRAVYPVLAWAGSLGIAGLVEWSLVGVNVLAFGVLAALAAAFARDRDLPPAVGLLVVASSGFVMTVARDLCEVVMVAGIVGGVVAIGRRRYGLAALAWSLAVLTHEQAVFVVAVYGIHRLLTDVRRARKPGAADLPWALPGVAFVACQAVVAAATTGEWAILASGGNNASFPLVEFLPELAGWVTGDLARQEALLLPELALVVAVVALAFRHARRVDVADRWLVWALAAGVLFASSLSSEVWVGPAELRQIVVVITLAWLVLFAARVMPPPVLTTATALVWVAVVGLRSVAI